MKEEILVQIAERAEPAECAGEENDSREIAEQKITQPIPARTLGKPNCRDQRRKRDPAEPALIERRKTGRAKQTAGNGGQPWPKAQCVFDHRAKSLTPPTPRPFLLTPAGRMNRVAQFARVGSVHTENGLFDIFHRVQS